MAKGYHPAVVPSDALPTSSSPPPSRDRAISGEREELLAACTIEAEGLSKRFGRVEAVRDVSFRVPDRCVCGLLGPNGAGKTTTIRMLAGLLVADEGELRVAGTDMAKDPDRARGRIGYLPESAPVHGELRTSELLRYRAELIGLVGRPAREAIDRAVAACELEPIVGRLVGALSKGYRQRVGLAAAILGDPRLVILDEPSVGLDPHQLLAFRALLRTLGRDRTVLLSSHILAEIEAVCDRAILIAGGRLVAEGPVEALRRRGGDRYVVEARGDAARAVMAAVEGLGSVADESLAGGWTRLAAVARTSAAGEAFDAREAIARAFAERGLLVRELRREQASLESLFLDATRSSTGTGGAR